MACLHKTMSTFLSLVKKLYLRKRLSQNLLQIDSMMVNLGELWRITTFQKEN